MFAALLVLRARRPAPDERPRRAAKAAARPRESLAGAPRPSAPRSTEYPMTWPIENCASSRAMHFTLPQCAPAAPELRLSATRVIFPVPPSVSRSASTLASPSWVVMLCLRHCSCCVRAGRRRKNARGERQSRRVPARIARWGSAALSAAEHRMPKDMAHRKPRQFRGHAPRTSPIRARSPGAAAGRHLSDLLRAPLLVELLFGAHLDAGSAVVGRNRGSLGRAGAAPRPLGASIARRLHRPNAIEHLAFFNFMLWRNTGASHKMLLTNFLCACMEVNINISRAARYKHYCVNSCFGGLAGVGVFRFLL